MSTNSSPGDEPVGHHTAINDDDALTEGLTPSASRPAQADVSPPATEWLGHYLRLHLTGAAGGIELFGRADAQGDEEARRALLHIRDELVEERKVLLGIAEVLGVSPTPLGTVAAKVGERVSRLKPNGDLLHRTPLTDLIDLETMRDAVAGKLAGWQALLAVTDRHPGLDLDQLADLLAQAERQHATLTDLHASAARLALA